MRTQQAELTQRALVFDGPAFDASRETDRLSSQFYTILGLMRDGQWRTLHLIAELTNYPESSISAQLRHARKPRFGGHTMNRRHIKNGLYEYQVVVNSGEEAA